MPTLKQLWVGLAIGSALIAFSFQGSRGLYETTEGRYAECAREMKERGDYSQPLLEYRNHWTKPPLTYQAIAAGMVLLGENEWGVRLYNALAFCLTVLAVGWIGTRLFNARVGLVAGGIYATTPFAMLGAAATSTDTLLTLWEICAVGFYISAVRRRDATPWKQTLRILGLWTCFGLGFLTKGPPALLPLVPILLWNLRQPKEERVRLFTLAGLLCFAATGLTWYIRECLLHPGLLSYFLGTEVIDRVASDKVHNNHWYKALYIYIPPLTVGMGAWVVFQFTMFRRYQLFRPLVLWRHLRSTGPAAFLLLWIATYLLVFFSVSSKLPLYVLPAIAPLALAVAYSRVADPSPARIRQAILIAVLSGLCLIASKGIAAHIPNKHDNRRLLAEIRSKAPHFELVLFTPQKLYGLQFYLKGHLPRWSMDPKAIKQGHLDLFKELQSLAATPGRTTAVLCQTLQAHKLCRIARDAGVTSRIEPIDSWSLCILSSANSPPVLQ